MMKLGYLIDENDDWIGGDPDWVFYSETNVPRYKIEYTSSKVKRIVYMEIEDE